MFVSILHDSGLGDRKTFGIYHRGKQCWSKFLLNCYLKGFWYDIIYIYIQIRTIHPPVFHRQYIVFSCLWFKNLTSCLVWSYLKLFFLGMYNTHWWVVLFAACHEHGLSGNIPESQVPVPLSEERCEDLRWLGCYWFKRLSFLKTTSAIEIGVWLAILLIGSFKFHCLHSLSLEFW